MKSEKVRLREIGALGSDYLKAALHRMKCAEGRVKALEKLLVEAFGGSKPSGSQAEPETHRASLVDWSTNEALPSQSNERSQPVQVVPAPVPVMQTVSVKPRLATLKVGPKWSVTATFQVDVAGEIVFLEADLPMQCHARNTYMVAKNMFKAYTELKSHLVGFKCAVQEISACVSSGRRGFNFEIAVTEAVNTLLEHEDQTQAKFGASARMSAKHLNQVEVGLGSFPMIFSAGVHMVEFPSPDHDDDDESNSPPPTRSYFVAESKSGIECKGDDPWYNLLDNQEAFHYSCFPAFTKDLKDLCPEGVPCDLITEYCLERRVEPVIPGMYTGLMIARTHDYRFVPALVSAINREYHEGSSLSGYARGHRSCIRFDGTSLTRCPSPLIYGCFASMDDSEDLTELLSEVFLVMRHPQGHLVMSHRPGETVTSPEDLERFNSLAQMTNLLLRG